MLATTRIWCTRAACGAGAALLVALAAAQPPEDPDYAALADDFVLSHLPPQLMAERAPSAVGFDELLELAYVHVDLGVFRVHYPKRCLGDLFSKKPKSLTYKRKANAGNAMREYQVIARTLVELQLRWVELVAQEEPGAPIDASQADAHLPGYTAVLAWIDDAWGAKPEQQALVTQLKKERSAIARYKTRQDVQQHAASFSSDLVQVITADRDGVRAALQSFGDTLRRGTFWSAEGAAARAPLDIVVCPTRGDIVGLALYVARARKNDPITWHPGVFQYTNVTFMGMAGLGMMYAEEGDDRDLFGGRYMCALDEANGVLRQHTAQHGLTKLFEYYYGPSAVSAAADVSPELKRDQRFVTSLLAGAKRYMVARMYGSNEVRDEGDVAARTQARSVFITGGMSEGGTLGPMSAEQSRWRKRESKRGDFVSDLIDNMQLPRTRDDEPPAATVELQPLGSKLKYSHVVQAPFLSREIEGCLPPFKGPSGENERDERKRLVARADLARDWVGFLRAYEIGFYGWLVDVYAPASGESGLALHARLHRRLFEVGAEHLTAEGPVYDLSQQLAPVVQEVYGVPLTTLEGSRGASLEERFLRWLADPTQR